MRRIYLVSIFLSGFFVQGFNQVNNSDPAQTYINVNTPRSPESWAFEKYGAAQVNEFTGTSSIDIPIYTLKSRFLEVPISLSYQATGIKVNQEASWVGLGWDLNAGGRITVEVRGCADFNGSTRGLTSPTNLATGMQRIFNRLGQHNENAVLTPSTLCEDGSGCATDTNFDNLQAVSDMTQYGVGEPDIFRANFLGHSVTFYVDKISNTIKFLGEQSLFFISYSTDVNNNITGWTIKDNVGIIYYFNQTETTTNTLTGNAIIPANTTTSWLLTMVTHPSGDYIQFTYNNYGYTAPAFTINGWVNYVAGPGTLTTSNDLNQNVSMQSPYYLTRIESADAAVDFSLATRTDLYGPGAKKLTQITVSDKITTVVKKTATFNYSYFQTGSSASSYLGTLFYYLPSPLTTAGYLACSSSRLRLDSVSINLSSYQPPYRFYYNSFTPDKYTYAQDHWGYYNAVANQTNGNAFTHLIPTSGTGGVGTIIPTSALPTTSLGSSRECDGSAMQAMILTSIVYPTGGSSSFTYEPHQSTMTPSGSITGGGLRVKTINNYESGNLIKTTNYTYSGGKYMGAIQYWTTANELSSCTSTPPNDGGGQWKYSSTGAVNFNDILIGYGQITIAEQSPTGQSNGYVVKTFNINTASSNYSNNVGFDIAPPYFPPLEPTGSNPYYFWMDPAHKDLPPTPSSTLKGKLMQEQFFDSLNNLIKSVNFYYHLANYSNQFYDIRAIQNRADGFSYISCSSSPNGGFGSGGNRPVYLFVSPGKSFHTLKDSAVEFTYSGSNFVKRKITYQYNAFYQPMFETLYNSDGTQTINYTRTSAEIYVPNGGGASGLFATQMYQMLGQHVLDLPIEQTVIHRSTTGDSSVISSRFNVYQNALPLQVYIMEAQQPLTFRSQFVPWFYSLSSSYSVTIDNHYNLYTSADYSTNNMIGTMHSLQGDKAFIWDEVYNTLLAQCTNTDSANIAFTSFETSAKGHWSYNSSGITADNSAPTGNNAYNLATANISLGSLTSSKTYVVSYWSKTGSSFTVTGSTSVKQGKTINGWTYFEHTVTSTTSVAISGSGSIDEVRLYPSTSQMITYTYSPLIGMTSQCDAVNHISYYFYDAMGRLSWIKDQDGNIIKTFQYHFQGLPGIQY